MSYRRYRSSQPEPIPEREEGWYWVGYPGRAEPFILFYGEFTGIDQDNHDRRIVCEYYWDADEYDSEMIYTLVSP